MPHTTLTKADFDLFWDEVIVPRFGESVWIDEMYYPDGETIEDDELDANAIFTIEGFSVEYSIPGRHNEIADMRMELHRWVLDRKGKLMTISVSIPNDKLFELEKWLIRNGGAIV